MNYIDDNNIFVSNEYCLSDEDGDMYYYIVSVNNDFTTIEYWEKERDENGSPINERKEIFQFPTTFTKTIGKIFLKEAKALEQCEKEEKRLI